MARKFINLTSHKLTPAQKEDAICEFGIDEFIQMPPELQKVFSQVPPTASTEDIDVLAEEFELFVGRLSTHDSCYIQLQGEFSLTVAILQRLQQWRNVTWIGVATTKREATETKNDDGSITTKHRFQHVRFREYPTF